MSHSGVMGMSIRVELHVFAHTGVLWMIPSYG